MGERAITSLDLARIRRDYEMLVHRGVKRVSDAQGRRVLGPAEQGSVDRLTDVGLVALDGEALILRDHRYATVALDELTGAVINSLHLLWLQIEDDPGGAGDEILYGELGYWQHLWNVYDDGTDRTTNPLHVDMIIPEREGVLTRHWAGELDRGTLDYILKNGLVKLRMIVPPALCGSNAETFCETLLQYGVDVRVFACSTEFSVHGGRSALFRDDLESGSVERHRLTYRRATVDPLRDLFAMRWAVAIPWESFVRGADDILELLAQGLTDEHIAASTGLSRRTVTRRISEMMLAADAHSRFALGVHYARGKLGAVAHEQ